MSSLIRTLFGLRKDQPHMHDSASFNDLSLGCGDDAEKDLAPMAPEHGKENWVPASGEQQQQLQPKPERKGVQTDVWRSVFNPGSNANIGKVGADYYDRVDDSKRQPTTWEYIIRAERKKAFDSLDKSADGFIDADDLVAVLGHSHDAERLIKEADKNGDGKIDYKEFCELLKNN
ncbi:hypothetical protein WJX72_000570 [[Myrmecia] bisecta]|uniref:EF-hand domain-containing protein n=1 Tax=[Myrmecia] bisecta TaxID=41462 RepID=A0AAW1PDQ3_9CHLO